MGELTGLMVLLLIGVVLAAAVLITLVVRELVRPPRHTAGYALARGLAVDPGENGLEFDGWWLERDADVRLPVWEINQGGESAPTLVLVHAWGESRIDSLAGVKSWLEVCDRVALYDLRGHGEADGGGSPLGHGEEHDLLALLDRLGEGPFVLAGHALGAAIAMAAAAASGHDRIRGVVALGPYGAFNTWLRGRLASARYPAGLLTTPAMLTLRASGLRFPETVLAAAAMRCPLLVVHRTDDRQSPPADGRRLADAAADGAFHAVSGDDRAYLDAIRSFVGRCLEVRPAENVSANAAG